MKLSGSSAMRRVGGTLARAACLWLASTTLAAAAERLDDSASPRAVVEAPVVLSDQGLPLGDALDPRIAIVKFGRVEYRLATGRYVGHRARIYLVVPPIIAGLRSPAGFRVDWRGDGHFASGTARAGERRLVWAGTVDAAWMTEHLDLEWRVDLNQMERGGRVALESYFELEVVR
jgi:hypothetical protein